MTVVVTGATGFLGGALVRRLLAEGAPVMALGRRAEALEPLRALGARIQAHDLTRPAAAEGEADAVVHCAALSSPWGTDAAFEAANVEGTRNALALARTVGARRFVHISTPSVYFRFADQIAVREDAPLPPPVNAYAASKARAEALVREETDLHPIILRPRGLYGLGDTALLPRLMRAAARRPLPLLRGGQAATDLTHVDDVVDAILAALGAPPGLGGTFNVSGGVALNLREVIERVAGLNSLTVRWRPTPVGLALVAVRALEAAARLTPGQPEPPVTAYGIGVLAFSQTLDIAAAADRLGWRPAIGFDEGLARAFDRAA